VSDTEVSELASEDRDTMPPRTLAEEVRDLTLAVVESNELSLKAQEAADRSREASERCANRLVGVLAQLQAGEKRFETNEREISNLKHRVRRIENRLGLQAVE
jgi:methyl-accepting chemotaxis protein